MVNPLLVGLLVILIGGGGAVVTHTIVNPDSPITESFDELVCNLSGTFEQFNDPDCPQYQTNNEPDPNDTNSTHFDIFDPDTWTPLTLQRAMTLRIRKMGMLNHALTNFTWPTHSTGHISHMHPDSTS